MFLILKLIVELLVTGLSLQCCKGYPRPCILSILLFIWFWFGHAYLTVEFCCLPGLILSLITFPPSRGKVWDRNVHHPVQPQSQKVLPEDDTVKFWLFECIIMCSPYTARPLWAFLRQGMTVAAQAAEFSHWEVAQNKTNRNKGEQTWAETVFWVCFFSWTHEFVAWC